MTEKTSLFVVVLLAVIYWTKACDVGWFGPKCQYKCRCSGNSCNVTGDCINGADCLAGWFGPACQFVDIASGKGVQPETTDGNHSTCRGDGTNIVTVKLDKPYPITWVRVHVRKSAAANILKASLVLRDDTDTYTPTLKKSIVHETTVDIHIDPKWYSLVNKKFKEVRVIGLTVDDVCTVQISGGRNVALKQSTSQSSGFSNHLTNTGPSKAVDSNTNNNFFIDKTCTHTAVGQSKADWNVTFSEPKMVNRYLLYNRESRPERLSGFILQGFQANGTKVVEYINSPATNDLVYSVSFPGFGSVVSRVNIKIKKNDSILTLCEVEIFGDSVCETGKYGRDCEHRCNCSDGETCFVSTGGCPASSPDDLSINDCDKPCKEGMYGTDCKSTCSKFCQIEPSNENSCDHCDGWCLHGCVDGYQGVRCSTPCDPGTYGQNCMHRCSEYCLQKSSNESSCDHVSGRCLHGCMSGYEGSRCLSRSIMLTISGCFPT